MSAQAVRIVGAPASGKTTLAHALSAALGLPAFSIDDERLRLMGPDDVWPDDDAVAWRRLRAALEAHPASIVETSGLSTKDRALFAGVATFTILCDAPAGVRRQRLIDRVADGYPLARTPDYVTRVGRLGAPSVRPAAIWHGNAPAPIAPLVERVRSWLAAPTAVAV